jgi:hypothetical protein
MESESENKQVEAENDRPGKPTVFLTNNFSWLHYLQWGGTIKATNLVKIADVKKKLSGRRIEAFFWPDTNLMGKLTLYGVLPMPDPASAKTPRDAEELMENAFYDWLSKELTKQTGQFVREVAKPPVLAVGKSIILCQMILPETPNLTIEIAGPPLIPELKTFWFEIEALELAPKPQSVKTA